MLFTLGALKKIQAGCLLTVSDVVVEGEFKRITDEEHARGRRPDDRARARHGHRRAISASTVFLVNPASAGGATGRRWPEIAHRAAALGLDGRRALLRAAGHLRELARARGRGRRRAGRRRRRRRHGQRGRQRASSGTAAPSSRSSRAAPASTSCRTFGIPTKLEDAVEVALDGRVRGRSTLGRVAYRAWAGDAGEAGTSRTSRASGMSGAVAKRTNESSKALGGKASYLWSTLAVFARWQNTEVRVTVDGETARRARCTT